MTADAAECNNPSCPAAFRLAEADGAIFDLLDISPGICCFHLPHSYVVVLPAINACIRYTSAGREFSCSFPTDIRKRIEATVLG